MQKQTGLRPRARRETRENKAWGKSLPLSEPSPLLVEEPELYQKEAWAQSAPLKTDAQPATFEANEVPKKVGKTKSKNKKFQEAEAPGNFVTAVGITHSGAVDYQIGTPDEGRLLIARLPECLADETLAQKNSSSLSKATGTLSKRSQAAAPMLKQARKGIPA
jgi:hypothetical protein